MSEPCSSPRRWVILARILLVTVVLLGLVLGTAYVLRLAVPAPKGSLSDFVPADAHVFLQAHRLAEGLRSLQRLPEWQGLAAGKRLKEALETPSAQKLLHRVRAVDQRIPFDLHIENAMLVFGEDAGVALRFDADEGGPDWLALTRTGLAVANPIWPASVLGNVPRSGHRGHAILHLEEAEPPVSVCAIGDLLLVSNSVQWLTKSIDLAVGPSTESLASQVRCLRGAETHLEAPHLSLTASGHRLHRVPDASGVPEADKQRDPGHVLADLGRQLAAAGVPQEILTLAMVFLSNKAELLESARLLRAWFPLDGRWSGRATVTLGPGPSETFVEASSLSFVDTLPERTAYAAVALVDFRQWFRGFLAEEEEEREAIKAETARYAQFLGIEDFEADFLALFGPEVAVVVTPQPAGGEDWRYPLPALSVVVGMKSPGKVAEFVQKSVQKAMADMRADHQAAQAGIPEQSRKPFPFSLEEVSDGPFRYSVLAMRENFLGSALKPAFGVLGNSLVFTTSSRFIQDLIQVTKEPGRSLAQRKGFRDGCKELSAPYYAFWYISPADLVEAILPTAESYVETHQTWPPEERAGKIGRLRELVKFPKLLETVIFTTRPHGREIGVDWTCRPAGD